MLIKQRNWCPHSGANTNAGHKKKSHTKNTPFCLCIPSVHCQDKNSGPVPMPMGAVRWFVWSLAACIAVVLLSDSILFIIISERTQKRDAKNKNQGQKSMQYLVKVNCETDFPVMLFLAVANGNVVRAVFCFRLFESALTQVCFKAYFVQPALSPPLLYARGFITVIHAAQP